jgi:hypothetical protein
MKVKKRVWWLKKRERGEERNRKLLEGESRVESRDELILFTSFFVLRR